MWYADGDGDGFGDPEVSTVACEAGSGQVGDDTDCDDADAGVYPGALETCDDLDQDCDGQVDEDACEADEPPKTSEPPEACGCATSNGVSAWPVLLALLPWIRRRNPACGVVT